MNTFVTIVIPILAGYLIGSIPEAWVLCKWVKGKDIRELGSGNVGVMNTALSVARWAGAIVFLLEAGKGVLAVMLPRWLGASELVVCITLLSAVIGTRWSIWLNYKGGRGNTAGIAGLAVISWQAFLGTILFWLLLRLLIRNSFLTTRITLFTLPVILAVTAHSVEITLMGFGLSLIYLSTQEVKSDDHTILKEKWSSFIAFLVSPPRRNKPH